MYTFGDGDDIDSHTYDDIDSHTYEDIDSHTYDEIDNNNVINDIKHIHTHTIVDDNNNKTVYAN